MSGQNDIVADSATDTLTLVGAGGATITTDNSTDTITITTSDTTYTAGDGLGLSGTTFSTDLKANGGLVIESSNENYLT